MFTSVNLSLFAIRVSQFSLHVSQMMHPSYFSIQNSEISYNFLQPFYNQYNDGLKGKKNCIFSGCKFSHFLKPVFNVLNGPDSDINRKDIIGERPKIDQNAANLTVFESLFQECKGNDGGVFFIVFNGDVIIEKSNFVNCSAQGRGGVIFFYGASLTILESCFSFCQSKTDGYCIFCASGRKKVDVEQCHFYESKGGLSTAVFLSGFDITTKKLNCTNSNVDSSLLDGSEIDDVIDLLISSSFYLSPSHFFSFEMNEIVNNTGPYIIYFDKTDQVDTIQNVNIINCKLANEKSTSLIYLTDGTTIFKNWGFVFADSSSQVFNSNNPLVIFTSSDNSTLTLQNCFFSLPESSISKDSRLVIDSSVKFGTSDKAKVDFIKTEGCWNQNRFIFREPKTYQKVIISVVVILIFLIGFIFMIVEACRDEKKHKELLKAQEYNEMQNELIQGDEISKQNEDELMRKKELSEKLLQSVNG